MQTVEEIVTHVSGQLSDQRRGQEFSRWPKDVLLEYLNLGLKEIAAYRPDAFSNVIKYTLAIGSRQSIETQGTIENVTIGGRTLTKTDIGLLRSFSAYAAPCPPSIAKLGGAPRFVIRSIAIDATDRGVFYVSPAVPAGVKLEAEVSVVGDPLEYTKQEWYDIVGIHAKYLNNLVDYMMARAYKRDSESLASEAKSQRLFQLFYQSMGQKYKIDSAFNSGYYKGEVGSGDPRAIV